MSATMNQATELFKSGYNCSQAVLVAFSEKYGLDNKTALKIALGLGSGARDAELCGAVSGAVLVIGLKYGTINSTEKDTCNLKVEEFIKYFKKRNKSIVCRQLLGCDITTTNGKEKALTENYFTTVCLDMVVSAVEILEQMGC